MEKEPFYMVFVEGERTPTFKHTTLPMAENEAKRLAKLTEKPAYVLASIKSIEIPPAYIVQDIRPTGTELPF